jgi:hypothetical protein
LGSDTKFIVDANGNRSLENVSVRPLDDNFDFNSDNPATAAFESTLQRWMDPSGLARRFELNFQNAGLVPRIPLYSRAQFNHDRADYDHYNLLPYNASQVYNGIAAIADELWDATPLWWAP